MTAVKVEIVRLPHAEGLPLPRYETGDSAGLDLLAAVNEDKPVTLEPGDRELIPTGLSFAIPSGYEVQVRPRSGLALRHGIILPNSPGTIDADYRGEIFIILVNGGREPFTVSRGDRIAQMVLAPVVQLAWEEVAALPESGRGEGGFGSTGRAVGDRPHPG